MPSEMERLEEARRLALAMTGEGRLATNPTDPELEYAYGRVFDDMEGRVVPALPRQAQDAFRRAQASGAIPPPERAPTDMGFAGDVENARRLALAKGIPSAIGGRQDIEARKEGRDGEFQVEFGPSEVTGLDVDIGPATIQRDPPARQGRPGHARLTRQSIRERLRR
jgi:hypothetical protein